MKILQICPDFPPFVRGGGSETFHLLAQEWTRQGHAVTVLTSVPSHAYTTTKPAIFPFAVEYFKLMSAPLRFQEASYFFPLRLGQFLRLRRMLRRYGDDSDVIVIHGLLETMPLLTFLLLRRSSYKVISTQYGISTAKHTRLLSVLSSLLYRTIGKVAISRFRNIVTFSQGSKREFLRYFGNSSQFQLVEIPLGVDIDAFKQNFQSARSNKSALRNWMIEEAKIEEPYIFSVGRNVKTKGFDILIRSFARVAEASPSLRLVIAGDVTAYTALLEGLASELGVRDRTILPGRISEEQKIFLMLNCSCFVIPSRKEGYGLNAVEAAILQVQTVATRTGAHEDILGNLSFSQIVPPDDEQALSATIRDSIDSEKGMRTFSPEIARKFDIKSLSTVYTADLEKWNAL